MSLDFSKISEISDARGKVVKITDASGRVIWAVPREVVSFTIDEPNRGTVTYQAEEGMTWGEWVNSAYNPERSGGYKVYAVEGNLIRNNDDGLYVSFWGGYNLQSPDTPIVPNGGYYLTRD